MSINLTKNKTQILDAWTKVTNNEDGYDWALFGYEGKTFELKVEAIGSGGIETICEEFNDGKIQYAFVRVKDPNTQLIKFILINFQGEAVLDLVHKGTCANHIKDVSRLLKNHLTITATNIDDLDEDTINNKVSKITSEYNFQQRTVPSDEKIKVGTNYERVIPTREINVVKRDEFWRKEEEIEKARVASEQEAKKLANLKIEEERAKREQSEHSKRELMNKDASIEKKDIVIAPKPVAMKPVERDESTRPKAEEMRADRRREAQELIGNRVNTAKAMWQQQAAQNSTPPVKASPPQKPIRKTILPKVEPEIEEQQQQQEQVAEVTKQIESLQFTDDNEQFSTIKRSPKTPDKGDNGFIIADNETIPQEITTPTTTPSENVEIQQQFQQIENEEIEFQKLKALEKQQKELEEAQKQLESISQDLQKEQEQQQEQQEEVAEEEVPMLKAVALYDYQAVDDTEISFDPGDIITHIDQIDEGWWQGYSERFGTYGLFPANYVEIIN